MGLHSTIPTTQLLEQAQQQLSRPFVNQQRKLLIYINVTYLFLAPLFLISERLSTGHYVPHFLLGYVYLFVGATNFVSAFYNSLLLSGRSTIRIYGRTLSITAEDSFDFTSRWFSILSIMFLSFLNMIGFGNPSSDSLLVDFAFGHSLIVLAAVLLGRRVALLWTCIIISILLFKTVDLGYSYQYNYLTTAESLQYETALQKKEQWALNRQRTLAAEGLKPPTVSRYFNEWLVFILIAFFTAWFFMGISLKMLKIIPSVAENIANAIESVNQQELERERFKQESLHAELNFLKSQINPHFLYNTLNYIYVKGLAHSEELADSIHKVSEIMRYSLREATEFVFIEEELTYLRDFISLHQLRNKNQLNIEFTVAGPTKQKTIIPFILISLVENAFKHGDLVNKNLPLIIKLFCNMNEIRFFMKNKKNDKPLIDSTHIGLANIQRRLDLSYPSSHDFKIEQDDDSFTCWLIITA